MSQGDGRNENGREATPSNRQTVRLYEEGENASPGEPGQGQPRTAQDLTKQRRETEGREGNIQSSEASDQVRDVQSYLYMLRN